MKNKLLSLSLFTLFFQSVGFGQCSNDSIYSYLDLWVGEWIVEDDRGNNVGRNRVEKILKGCAVQEYWTSLTSGIGQSLFYVDNLTKTWKQVWVTSNAKQPWGQKEKIMIFHWKGLEVVFQGSYKVKGATVLDRTILKRANENTVEQTIEISFDGGRSWEKTFKGIYRPSG